MTPPVHWPTGPEELGLITHARACQTRALGGLGLTPDAVRWQVQDGRWQRLTHGVYLRRDGPVDWLTWAGAALLGYGSRAALRGESAAYIHHLTAAPPQRVHLVLPFSSGRRMRGVEVVRQDHARVLAAWPPRTTWDATVIDLATGSADDIASLLNQALRQRRTTTDRLRHELARREKHPQRPLVLDILGETDGGSEGPLERRFVRSVLRPHRLPVGSGQLPAALISGHAGDGRRFDRGIQQYRVAFELDGAAYHHGRAHPDRRKSNLAARYEWLLLRYGWAEIVDHPCDTAIEIAHALTDRGWRGVARACTAACPMAHPVRRAG